MAIHTAQVTSAANNSQPSPQSPTLDRDANRVVVWDNELNASAETHGPLMARAKSGGDRNGVLAFHHTQTPISGDVAPAIGRTTDGMGVVAFQPGNLVRRAGSDPSDSVIPTLGAKTQGDQFPHVVCTTGHITHALTHEGADASEDGTGRGTPIVAPTLSMGAHTAAPGSNGQDAAEWAAITTRYAGRPRRLTPRECERLMSWPDDWTRYGRREDGTVYELSDTARYRLCGNGVASVVAEWIATRLTDAIKEADNA